VPSSWTQKTRDFPNSVCAALAAICLLFACYIALRYAGAPLVDKYSFRQTQTALTAYWLSKDGFRLAYETPVAGYPWSIPFEFPIYQYLAALISRTLGASLDPVGRLLSFAFTFACLIPVRSIVRKLALPCSVFFAFVCLFFSSSIYLYWGRTFMIESAALFFALCSLPFFLDLLREGRMRSALWFSLFASLAMLQKVTTELPLLVLLGLTYLGIVLKAGGVRAALRRRSMMTGLVCFVIPVAIGTIWTLYADAVKVENALGAQLTSRALDAWNWGTLKQRASSELFVDVIWGRIIRDNLAGYLGVTAFIAAPWVLPREHHSAKSTLIFSIVAGILPLFFFTNLHIIHSYYQTANVVFLIFGLALITGFALESGGRTAALAALGLVAAVVSNAYAFDRDYVRAVMQKNDIYNTRSLAVGAVISRELSADQAFVAFGNDWSSELAYFSQRKAFSVPTWFAGYEEALRAPQRFVGDSSLGAVLACLGSDNPALGESLHWMFQAGWNVAYVYGCFMAVPHAQTGAIQPVDNPSCEGDIAHVSWLQNVKVGDSLRDRLLEIDGWTTMSGADGKAPEQVYLSFDREKQPSIVRRAMQFPRGDVNQLFGGREIPSAGFSLVMKTEDLSGDYSISLLRRAEEKFERCQWRLPMTIN